MSRTKAGLSAGNMCMHMHVHSASYTLHVRTSTTTHTSRPTHQVDSADSPTSCVAGSKEHAQAQAACASLDNAACAAYHEGCVKDHCAGWSTALEARAVNSALPCPATSDQAARDRRARGRPVARGLRGRGHARARRRELLRHGRGGMALRVLLEESQQLKADAEKLLSGAGVEGEVRSNFEVGMVRTPKL